MTENIGSKLHVFYDFNVCGFQFDFLTFLIYAEHHRRRVKAEKIHVIFVPRHEDVTLEFDHHAIEEADWRLRNLLVPACYLLPSCHSVTVCSTRLEAETILAGAGEALFPDGLSLIHI